MPPGRSRSAQPMRSGQVWEPRSRWPGPSQWAANPPPRKAAPRPGRRRRGHRPQALRTRPRPTRRPRRTPGAPTRLRGWTDGGSRSSDGSAPPCSCGPSCRASSVGCGSSTSSAASCSSATTCSTRVWPMVGLNVVLAAINIYFLVTMSRQKHDARVYEILGVGGDDDYLRHVLRVHEADIRAFNPGFVHDPFTVTRATSSSRATRPSASSHARHRRRRAPAAPRLRDPALPRPLARRVRLRRRGPVPSPGFRGCSSRRDGRSVLRALGFRKEGTPTCCDARGRAQRHTENAFSRYAARARARTRGRLTLRRGDPGPTVEWRISGRTRLEPGVVCRPARGGPQRRR